MSRLMIPWRRRTSEGSFRICISLLEYWGIGKRRVQIRHYVASVLSQLRDFIHCKVLAQCTSFDILVPGRQEREHHSTCNFMHSFPPNHFE